MTAQVSFNFPHPTLPSLHGPELVNGQRLDRFLRPIRANALSVASNGGNGLLGHLSLVVNPDVYELQSGGIPFVVPANPGLHPVHPENATGPQITEINRSHLALRAEHTKYVETSNALQAQVLEAVPDHFIRPLADPITEYANVSVLTIVNQLVARFGTITDEELQANALSLQRPWAPTDAIDTVWANINECRAFAVAGEDPISDRTTIAAALLTLERTGQFTLAVHEWHNKPAAEKTYANLVTHFNAADRERLRLLTTRNAGFHGNALHAAAINAPPVEQALIAPGAAPAVVPPAAAPPAAANHPTPMFYCHSHGLGTNPAHTSLTCRTRGPGHDTTATVNNMRGGCNLIQRRRNERVVWTAPPPRATNPAPAANN